MKKPQPLLTHGPHTGKARCQKLIYKAGAWDASQCSRRATIGNHCKQHSPEAKAERDKARDTAWKEQRAAENRLWNRQTAGRDALAAIAEYFKAVPGIPVEPDSPVGKMHAALTKFEENGGIS